MGAQYTLNLWLAITKKSAANCCHDNLKPELFTLAHALNNKVGRAVGS